MEIHDEKSLFAFQLLFFKYILITNASQTFMLQYAYPLNLNRIINLLSI